MYFAYSDFETTIGDDANVYSWSFLTENNNQKIKQTDNINI
jgi:hypothetical protein